MADFIDRTKLEALAEEYAPTRYIDIATRSPSPSRYAVTDERQEAFLAGAAAYAALLDAETTEEWQHYKPARGGYKNAYPGRKEGNVKPEYLDEWEEERRRVLYGPWLPSEGGES